MHFKYDISRCDYHRYQFIHTLFALYTSAISCSSPFFTPTAFRFVYYFLSISSFIFDMLVICYATLFVLYIFAITVYEIIICYFVFCSNRAIFSHYCYSCIRTNWLHEFHFFSLVGRLEMDLLRSLIHFDSFPFFSVSGRFSPSSSTEQINWIEQTENADEWNACIM